ncbi:hypothetical protein TNCV_4056851 [Trichonephila clavipes]|nr:hypothetical protein TNCV_4056851 [Trichonephila clavipes]
MAHSKQDSKHHWSKPINQDGEEFATSVPSTLIKNPTSQKILTRKEGGELHLSRGQEGCFQLRTCLTIDLFLSGVLRQQEAEMSLH